MDYRKIKEEISRKNLNEKYFIPETTGLTVQGFNKAIKKGTLKVADLEMISKALGIGTSYWFKDEELTNLEEAKQAYGEPASVTIKRLNRQIDEYLSRIEKIEAENDLFREKLGIRKVIG